MHFLPDVWVICYVCKGSLFNRETLHIKWKGLTIADVLELDVAAALDIFENVPRINRIYCQQRHVRLIVVKLCPRNPPQPHDCRNNQYDC